MSLFLYPYCHTTLVQVTVSYNLDSFSSFLSSGRATALQNSRSSVHIAVRAGAASAPHAPTCTVGDNKGPLELHSQSIPLLSSFLPLGI